MIEVRKLGWPKRVAKKLVPKLGPMLRSSLVQDVFTFVEIGSAILQGKGAGTGWDISSEVRVALPFIGGDTSIVFDVGANIGEWTQQVIAGKGTPTIFLFEPQESCLEDLNKLPREHCKIVNTAVGDQDGTTSFYSPGKKAGVASVYNRKDSYFDDLEFSQITVPIITIDNFIDSNGISRVDYMKIDVEGNELAVLKGAERALSHGKISALSFEFGSANVYSRTFFKDFWDFLHNHNYIISRITPSGFLLRIDKYYEDLEYFREVSNYVAVNAGS